MLSAVPLQAGAVSRGASIGRGLAETVNTTSTGTFAGQRSCPSDLHGLRWVETPGSACSTVTPAFGSWNRSLDSAPLRQYCTQPRWWIGPTADVAVLHDLSQARALGAQLPEGGRAWVSLNVSGSSGSGAWSWPVRPGGSSTYGLADAAAWEAGTVPPPVDGLCAILNAKGMLEPWPCTNRSTIQHATCSLPPCRCDGPLTARNCTTSVRTMAREQRAGFQCVPLEEAPAVSTFHVWRDPFEWNWDADDEDDEPSQFLRIADPSFGLDIGCGSHRITSASSYDRELANVLWRRGDGLITFSSSSRGYTYTGEAMDAWDARPFNENLFTDVIPLPPQDWNCSSEVNPLLVATYRKETIQFNRPRVITSGPFHFCVILRQPRGAVRCWGGGAPSFFSVLDEVVAVPDDLQPVSSLAANQDATCTIPTGFTDTVLRQDFAIRCWGGRAAQNIPSDSTAQSRSAYLIGAGSGSTGSDTLAPPQMCVTAELGLGKRGLTCWATMLGVVRVPSSFDIGSVLALSSGDAPNCAVQERTLKAACWDVSFKVPADVPPVHALAGSDILMCAHLLGSGRVRCWTLKEEEEGDPFPLAQALSATQPVSFMAYKADQLCIILAATGEPRCYSRRVRPMPPSEWPRPTSLPPLVSLDLSCAGRCACGVSAINGSVHCWGEFGRVTPTGEYEGPDPRVVPEDVQSAGVLHPSAAVLASFRGFASTYATYASPLTLDMAHPLAVAALEWRTRASVRYGLDLFIKRVSAPFDAASAQFALLAADSALAWPEIALWIQEGETTEPMQVFCEQTRFFSDYLIKCSHGSPVYGSNVRWWTGLSFNSTATRRPGVPAMGVAVVTPSAYAASVAKPQPNIDIAGVVAQLQERVSCDPSRVLAVRPGDEVTVHGTSFGLHAAKLPGAVPWYNPGPGMLRSCIHLAWWASPASYHNDSSCVCNGLEDWLGEGELPLSAMKAWNDTLIRFRAPMGEGIREVRLCVEGRGLGNASNAPRSSTSLYLVWEPPALAGLFPGSYLDYVGRETQVAAELTITAPGEEDPTSTWGRCVNGSSPSDIDGSGRILYPSPIPVDVFSQSSRHCTTAAVVQDSLGRCASTSSATPRTSDVCTQGLSPVQFRPGQTTLPPYSAVLPARVFESGTIVLPLDAPVPSAVLNMTYSVYTWDAGIRIEGSTSHSSLILKRTPPVLRSISPNPLLLGPEQEGGAGAGVGAVLTLNGEGLRTLEDILDSRNGLLGIVARPNATVTIDGTPCAAVSVTRTREFPLGYVTCVYPAQVLNGGIHVVRMTMVDIETTLDPSDGLSAGLYTACAAGYYGLFAVPGHQVCRPCPRGALCAEGVGLPPIAQAGFYNLGLPVRSNASGLADPVRQPVVGISALGPSSLAEGCPSEASSDRDRPVACVVPCDPPEACLGDNVCAPGYTSTAPAYRCSSCAAGYFRTSGVCSKCPTVGSITVLLLVLTVLASLGLLYVFSKNDIRLGTIDMVLEYAQLISLLQGPSLPWPSAVKAVLNSLSILRVNIEVTAPECYSSISLTPELKLWLVLILPVIVLCCAGAWYWLYGSVRGWLSPSRARGTGRAQQAEEGRGRQKDVSWSHGPMVCRTTLKLLGALYLPVVATSLEVWNCTPTDPPDGFEYLAISFEPCWVPGGLQDRMIPWAQAGLLLYGALYPALLACFLYLYSHVITEDQILAAAGTGDCARSNPRAHTLRQYFSPLYVDYRPGRHWFALVKLARCALVCICALMLNKSSVLMAASIAFVMYIAVALHNAVSPLMTPQTGHAQALQEWSLRLRQGAVGSEWHRFWAGRLAELARVTQSPALQHLASGRTSELDVKAGTAAVSPWRPLLDWNLLESQLKGQVILTALLSIMYTAGSDSVYAARGVPAVTAAFFLLQLLIAGHVAVTVGWDILLQVHKALEEWIGSFDEDEEEVRAAQQAEGVGVVGRVGEEAVGRLPLYDEAQDSAGRVHASCVMLYLCCFRCCVDRARARHILTTPPLVQEALTACVSLEGHGTLAGADGFSLAHTGATVTVSEWTKNPLEKPEKSAVPDRRAHSVAMLYWSSTGPASGRGAAPQP